MTYKIIELNIEEDTYKVVLGENHGHKTLMEGILKYAHDNVHWKDKPRFLDFFTEHYGRMPQQVERVFYRRKVNDEWKFACAELIGLDEPLVLLIIKDIEDDVSEFFKQLKD